MDYRTCPRCGCAWNMQHNRRCIDCHARLPRRGGRSVPAPGVLDGEAGEVARPRSAPVVLRTLRGSEGWTEPVPGLQVRRHEAGWAGPLLVLGIVVGCLCAVAAAVMAVVAGAGGGW